MPMISTDFHQLPTYNSPERIISSFEVAWRLKQNRDSRSFRVGVLTVPPTPAMQVILSVFAKLFQSVVTAMGSLQPPIGPDTSLLSHSILFDLGFKTMTRWHSTQAFSSPNAPTPATPGGGAWL